MQLSSSVPFSGDELLSPLQRRRVVDTTRREVRNLLAIHISGFGELHEAAAMLTARTMRQMTDSDREELACQCTRLQETVQNIRVGLLEDFAEQPARIAGDPRVSDTERALDMLENKVIAARVALGRVA